MLFFHNPSCSKSRQALELCRSRDIDGLEVIEYLREGLELETLTSLLDALGGELESLIRIADLCPEESPSLGLLVEKPKYLQRPILWNASKAVIGRPPEKVLELLN